MMLENLRSHMESNGLSCHSEIQLDGVIHRYCRNSTKSKDEWYVADSIGDHIWCTYGSWSQDKKFHYRSWGKDTAIKPDQLKKYKLDVEKAKKEWERECENKRQSAKNLLDNLNKTNKHKYLKHKKIDYEIYLRKKDLLIPIYSMEGVNRQIISCQKIDNEGNKKFYPGLPITKGVYWFGIPDKNKRIIVCEGWATGYSIWKSTQIPTCVCFSSSNIYPVVSYLQSDGFKDIIHGQDADEAGNRVSMRLNELGIDSRLPGKDCSDKYDFNDLYCEKGVDAVRECFTVPNLNLSFWDIQLMDIEPPKFLINDFMYEKTTTMLWAQPGVGKSRFLYSLSAKLSLGNKFLWLNSENPLKILYIDGEQTLSQLKGMFPFIAKMKFDAKKELKNNFMTLTKDRMKDQLGSLPNLCLDSHRNFIDTQLNYFNPDLIIFDNYSALFAVDGMEHQTKELYWLQTMKWFDDIKEKGSSIILTHHSTKGGESYAGLAQMRRLIDVEISLKRYDPEAHNSKIDFWFNFEKARLPTECCKKRRLQWSTLNPEGWREIV